MKHTETLIKTHYRPIVGLLFAFILVFGIGFGSFGENRVEASNPYISNIQFYSDLNGIVRMKFFVNTSFDITIGAENGSGETRYCYIGIPTFPFGKSWNLPQENYPFTIIVPDDVDLHFTCGTTFNYVAGNTYDNIIMNGGSVARINATTKKICILNNCSQNYDYTTFSGIPTSATYFANFGKSQNINSEWPMSDTEFYYFSEVPTLDITFPFENAEISEAFYITGSYTIPENSGITKLIAFFRPVDLPYPTYSFHQDLTYLSGDVNIRSSGIQADDYEIEFCFVGTGIEAICLPDQNINISIVSRIPPEFPETQEQPPEVFDPIDADQFYIDFSNYATPTALFINLKSAIQPIFTTIGSNLTFFTSRFDVEIAKETGERTGQAILLIRTYSSNLNTFFNDLPVSEFLLFYLTLLIVVIVFRIIKNLINLIKP